MPFLLVCRKFGKSPVFVIHFRIEQFCNPRIKQNILNANFDFLLFTSSCDIFGGSFPTSSATTFPIFTYIIPYIPMSCLDPSETPVKMSMFTVYQTSNV